MKNVKKAKRLPILKELAHAFMITLLGRSSIVLIWLHRIDDEHANLHVHAGGELKYLMHPLGDAYLKLKKDYADCEKIHYESY